MLRAIKWDMPSAPLAATVVVAVVVAVVVVAAIPAEAVALTASVEAEADVALLDTTGAAEGACETIFDIK